jgi:CDP-diacylglycerol--glycerol-3-phosphate 3-phosphatidyltransferase
LLGARLDAVADGATYLVLFLAVQRLWPDFLASHFAILVGLVGLYAINHIWALVRFRQLPAYHTWAGKAAAVLMAPGVMVWFISGQGMLLTVAFIVAIVSVVEQFAITTCLPNWRADVPTFVHALRLRRATQQNHSH